MTRILLCLLLLLPAACAPGRPATSSKEKPLPLPQLTLNLGDLPGAILSEGDLPTISYPEQSLFAPAAVLPQVGSEAILDPLADLLRSQTGWHWQATVRAVSAYGGAYDQQLAEGRARLLKRYLTARGVDPKGLSFKAVGMAGTPFELRPLAAQNASPARTSGVKE